MVESVDGIRRLAAEVLLLHEPAILVSVRGDPMGVVVMVHVLHPRRSRHLAAAVLFKLVVHLAHVTQVLTDALNATKQCSTAVDMRVSGPARRHVQILALIKMLLRQLVTLVALLRRAHLFIPHLCIVKAD